MRELAIVKFSSRWLEKTESGLYVMPEFATTNRFEYANVHGEILGLPDQTGDYPITLRVGDHVVCEYGCMDDKQPLSESKDGVLFHLHLSEILYKKRYFHTLDGSDLWSPEMQSGWVLGRPTKLVPPPGAVKVMKDETGAYWANENNILIQRVSAKDNEGKCIVAAIGKVKPSLEELEYKVGDTVIMEKDCEFTNAGHNKINGSKYWFVRQEDIIGKIYENEN